MTAESHLPDRAQVVIVGGGVTGCSIAYHLAHAGLDATWCCWSSTG